MCNEPGWVRRIQDGYDIPDTIYIQLEYEDDTFRPPEFVDDMSECTWCRERIFATDVEYRRVPAMPEPDWDEAPDWAVWGVIQPNGVVNFSEADPRLMEDFWFMPSRYWHGPTVELPLGIDWRLTLQRRPGKGEEA